ncbi:MAG: thiol-disulfide isomerase/thioredoxin [Myxococcota bacterium]|jgi:thiol-disulfide isomerase/thioredoxin
MKRPLIRKILRLLRDVAGIVLLALIVGHVAGAIRAPDLPEQAPDFAVKDTDGEVFRLSEHQGKRIVLNFWATWCMPCRIEAPAFSRWSERNPDALLIGIAADGTDEELRAAAADLGITYRIARGYPELLKRYDVTTFPTTVVIGEKGDVVTAHTGLLTDPQLAWLARER